MYSSWRQESQANKYMYYYQKKNACLVSNQVKPSNQLTKLYDFHYQSGEGRENIKEKFKGKYMV